MTGRIGDRPLHRLDSAATARLKREDLARYGAPRFRGGPGKTAGPPEFGTLIDDLESRVFGTLPDETWAYPGHGDDTTLGAERPSLPPWRERGW